MEHTNPEQLQQLLARCALKDQVAFKQLYDRTASKLNGIAYRILHNIDSANEVLQEAFIQIWGNAGDYRADLAEPMTWMASIVRYRAFDRLKFEKRRIEGSRIKVDLTSFESLVDDKGVPPVSCDLGRRLQDCLQRLDKAHQESILMAYYYGFSREEISAHFNKPVNTVKSWLKRGLERLLQCLQN